MSDTKFEVLRMPPENTNSLLVYNANDCVIFDAWGHVSDWCSLLDGRGLKLRAIYTTHGHSDHLSAAPGLAEHYNVDWFLNFRDEPLILWGNQILDFWELPHIPGDYKKPKGLIAETVHILPGVPMQIMATPGHSLGGMVFYFPIQKILMTGDTIFKEGIGRYDLPGGNANELRNSISKIAAKNFPDDTYVVHGHGDDSVIKWLRENNPWFKCKA